MSLKKEKQNLEKASEELLSYALKSGAEAVEVCGGYGQKNKITLEKQDYHLASSDDGYSFGVRVLIGKKQGFASCNTLDSKDLKEMAMKAVEIAGLSPENPYFIINNSNNVPIEAPKDLWDDALYNLSLQTQKDWTKAMVQEVSKDKRFRLNEGGIEIASGLSLLANSFGKHEVEKESVALWSLMGMGVEGENITSFDYFSNLSRKASTIPEKLMESTRKFRDSVLKNLQTGKGESYKGVVFFTPRAALDIFIHDLLYHANGRNIVEGTSRWKKESLGNKVIESSLTITDNPWLTDRMSCSNFDREGTPTQPQTLIEKGVLKTILMDHYAAKALHLNSTGHAGGGPTSLPTVGTHTVCVQGGKESLSSLHKKVSANQKNYLVVHRFSGQVDPITGDFSGVAKGSDWYQNGERAFSTKEILISGNLFESLGKNLMGISHETEIVDCGDESPWLAIDQISVTAG